VEKVVLSDHTLAIQNGLHYRLH